MNFGKMLSTSYFELISMFFLNKGPSGNANCDVKDFGNGKYRVQVSSEEILFKEKILFFKIKKKHTHTHTHN